MDELPNNEDLLALVADHQAEQVPRLQMLHRYHIGKNDGILNRKRRFDENKSDYRTPHPFAENITTFRTAYFVGVPVKTEFRGRGDEYDALNDVTEKWNQREDMDAHNIDLATDLSKFGRAYEMMYRGTDDETHIAISNPEWTFVVYDTTVQQEPLFAVRYPSFQTKNELLYYVTVYTDKEVIEYAPTKIVGGELREVSRTKHFFGDVPVVEATFNRYRMGDYEKVIPLIDLYDAAQSDTGNYMTDTNESLLVVTGDFNPDEVDYDPKANMMLLPTGVLPDNSQSKIEAKFMHPEYDVHGVEAHKERLRRDIYLFSYTPDVSDQNFAGTQSGEAMKYKLLGLQQDRAIKERLIRKVFTRRYGMLLAMGDFINETEGKEAVKDLVVTFTPNLPVNLTQELPVLSSAGAKFSQSTLLSQASFVDNVEDEIKAVEEERQQYMGDLQSRMRGADNGEEDLLANPKNRRDEPDQTEGRSTPDDV